MKLTKEKDMHEVLVWVMGDAAGTRILIGSWGTNGVIYRCDWVGLDVDRGTYRSKLEQQSALDVYGITQRAEDKYDMILEPTVLRVPPPPLTRDGLNDWVDEEIWPVAVARMAGLSFSARLIAKFNEVNA